MSSQLQQAVQESAAKADESLTELRSVVTSLSREVARMADDEAHRSPWRLAGGVAVVSVALGFLIGRSSKG